MSRRSEPLATSRQRRAHDEHADGLDDLDPEDLAGDAIELFEADGDSDEPVR